MRVRIEPAEQNDMAITRVRNALKQYAPAGLEFIEDPGEFDVDLLVMNINGRCGRTKRRIAKARNYGAEIIILQISLLSTINPDVRDWMPVWDIAKMIWSYYDLPQIAIDQGVEPTFADKFYRAPLGADSETFKPSGAEKKYRAITVTRGYLTESTREIIRAIRQAGGEIAYVGPHMEGLEHVHELHQFENVSDEKLADLYSSSYYVCALRRNEGQDLPAAEGLLCGARPIVFDRADQADWYGEFSVVIKETGRDQIERDLATIFKEHPEPEVHRYEIEKAKEVFSWQKFAEGVWSWL
ncbi:MAG: hypothetical protein ACYTFW_00445 [Planctomycetota bacterium]